jgi:hypothetical protein
MVQLRKIFYTTFPILLFITVIIAVLSFLGIGIDTYAIYLGWILSAMIFYLVLPSKQSMLEF